MVYTYTDIVGEGEMFSDEFKLTTDDKYGPGIICIESKKVPSENNENVQVIDVVEFQNLQESGYKKKPALLHLKGYMGAVKEKLTAEGKEEECKEF